MRELAGLPGLLARVPVEILDPEEPPTPVPDTLLPALVRRARRSQRRRTWVTGGLVAAAAVAAVAIGAVGVATLGDDDDAPPQRAAVRRPDHRRRPVMKPVGDEPISGWISLTQVGWGTRLDLDLQLRRRERRLRATRRAPTYTMYVHTADGNVEQVASWKALPGKTMHLAAATAVRRGRHHRRRGPHRRRRHRPRARLAPAFWVPARLPDRCSPSAPGAGRVGGFAPHPTP